ncbi:MAG TPA: ABC transporter ATP-binding protein [Anaerolineales bacterium]|nr:ABC transporter ATP-binding protein [Anaerolineales bacterium]
MTDVLLDIRDLHVAYRVYGGELKVLNGVNFKVAFAEKVGLVGETGCGKTTTMKALLRILPRTARIPKGQILIHGGDVLKMNRGEIADLRGRGLSMIFQDPTSALNPVFTIGQQLYDVIRYSRGDQVADKREVALRALQDARLPDPERMLDSYPVQLSGGMRQRVCIAFAVATARDLLIADEPTTNLDVTIQDQVLRLIRELVEQKGSSLILITHSLGLVRETTDRVYVMYAGNMVEMASTEELFEQPLHPYTQGLLASVPRLTGGGFAEGIPGRIPDYKDPPTGCRFHPRCPHAFEPCAKAMPPFFDQGNGHQVACYLYQEKSEGGTNV